MIVVHIPHDSSTVAYTDYCFDAMKRMASKPEEVERMLHICPSWPKEPADNHCKAVGEAFRMVSVKPDAVHVICDSDTVVVMPDWDLVINQLFETYDVVGTAYQRMGTAQTGFGRKQTYKDKPNIEWMALKPGKPWHLFEPARTNRVPPVMVETAEDEALWGLSRGCELLSDACWNFPLFLRDHQLTSLALLNVEPKQYVALQGLAYYEEWHLDGVPFVVHQGRSRKNRFRSTGFSADFYDRADTLVRPPQSS